MSPFGSLRRLSILNSEPVVWRFTGARNSGKIDYIFVPVGTRVMDAEIVRSQVDGVYPSDHYPVRATLEFPAD